MKFKFIKSPRFLVVSILIISILFMLLGMMFGFPLERLKMANAAKQYIEEEYGLYVTDTTVHISIDGMDKVEISTKEWPFKFYVLITRDEYRIYGDLYLEALVEYSIEEMIKDRIDALPDSYKINVILENRFSNDHPEISVEDIVTNPDSVFNVPIIQYRCLINIDEIDHEKCYSIFEKIMEQFNPTSIKFYDTKGQVYSLDKTRTQQDGPVVPKEE